MSFLAIVTIFVVFVEKEIRNTEYSMFNYLDLMGFTCRAIKHLDI
jgi:hypothetical protein